MQPSRSVTNLLVRFTAIFRVEYGLFIIIIVTTTITREGRKFNYYHYYYYYSAATIIPWTAGTTITTYSTQPPTEE